MKRPRRAALYARVSTAEQDHALQLDELRRVAAQRGYAATEYIDTCSGAAKKLPERERLLVDAGTGALDVVLVWRFDRFARSTRDLLDALDNFRQWGVEFISLRDGVDTSTATGKLVFTIVAALAEFERALIIERVRAGISAAKRRGKRVGRPRRVFDHQRARDMIESGVAIKATARRLGVSARTLRRALAEGQKPLETLVAQTAEIPCPNARVESGGKT